MHNKNSIMPRAESYLEIHEPNSARYWHLVQEGTRHTLRFGSLINHSETEQVKLFDTEEEAQKAFAKRIKEKLRQGWVECQLHPEFTLPTFASTMLDYEPIGQEELSLFTPTTVSNASESVLRQWQRLGKMLYEGLSLQGAASELRRDLEPMEEALREIASWDCPDMQKGVKRTEHGHVLEVAYFISGMRVLILERGQLHATRALPRWRTFWYWHRPVASISESLVDDARTLLSRFTHFCAEHLPTIIAKEEKRVREEKVKSVAEGNIALMVKSLMTGKGYTYQLLEATKTTKLRVKMREYVELSLPHRTFPKRIGKLLPTLARVEELLASTALFLGIDSSISVFEDSKLSWGQVQRHFIPAEPSYVRASIDFWEPRIPECLDLSPFLNGESTRDEGSALASLMALDIPGLQMEGSWVDTTGELRAVKVWHGEEQLLYIDGDSLDICLTGNSHAIRQETFPSLAQWKQQLCALSAFYESQLPDYERAKEEAIKKHTELREGQLALEESIRRIMADSPYEWALELLPHKWSTPLPGRLFLLLAKRRVLCLYFSYENVAEQVAAIPQTMDLVLKTEKDCKLTYKIG